MTPTQLNATPSRDLSELNLPPAKSAEELDRGSTQVQLPEEKSKTFDSRRHGLTSEMAALADLLKFLDEIKGSHLNPDTALNSEERVKNFSRKFCKNFDLNENFEALFNESLMKQLDSAGAEGIRDKYIVEALRGPVTKYERDFGLNISVPDSVTSAITDRLIEHDYVYCATGLGDYLTAIDINDIVGIVSIERKRKEEAKAFDPSLTGPPPKDPLASVPDPFEVRKRLGKVDF